nr:MAG TPA: hypothetical protein [Inoviridae sp.]
MNTSYFIYWTNTYCSLYLFSTSYYSKTLLTNNSWDLFYNIILWLDSFTVYHCYFEYHRAKTNSNSQSSRTT